MMTKKIIKSRKNIINIIGVYEVKDDHENINELRNKLNGGK